VTAGGRTDADGQCRLVYQSGIVGAIVALLDTSIVRHSYIQSAREKERERDSGLLNPCFHSLPETLFISLVSSSLAPPPRNKNPNCAGGGRPE